MIKYSKRVFILMCSHKMKNIIKIIVLSSLGPKLINYAGLCKGQLINEMNKIMMDAISSFKTLIDLSTQKSTWYLSKKDYQRLDTL